MGVLQRVAQTDLVRKLEETELRESVQRAPERRVRGESVRDPHHG